MAETAPDNPRVSDARISTYPVVNVLTEALRNGDVLKFVRLANGLHEELRESAQSGEKIIRTRTHRLTKFKESFLASDFITYLRTRRYCRTEAEAHLIGCTLVHYGIIEHYTNEVHFKKSPHTYFRFMSDKSRNFPASNWESEEVVRALRGASVAYGLGRFCSLIAERRVNAETIPDCVIAKDLVTFWVIRGYVQFLVTCCCLRDGAHVCHTYVQSLRSLRHVRGRTYG